MEPKPGVPACRARLDRAVDHMRLHLGEALTLAQLARAANFSVFHFHRLFRAHLGETVGGCLQRLRLEKAALDLVQHPHRAITVIALDCGFGTSAAFARAFRRHFGQTATQWRRDLTHAPGQLRKFDQMHGKAGKDAGAPLGNAGASFQERPMEIQVKHLPELTLASVRHVGSYLDPGMEEVWDRLLRWARPRGLLRADTLAIGICHDHLGITPEACMRYDACVTVPPSVQADEGVNIHRLPKGPYAVARYEGPATGLQEAYQQIYGSWMGEGGYEPGDSPAYEVYLNDGRKDPDRIYRVELRVPLQVP